MSLHIVFDFDGTLINSHHHVYLCVGNSLSRYLGREISFKEVVKNFDANISKFYEKFGIFGDEAFNKVQEFWQEEVHSNKDDFPLFEGIKDMLNLFKNKGHTLSIWTARDYDSTLMICDKHKIADLFTDIQTCTQGPMKPHPFGLEQIIKGGDRSKFLMCGDSYTDIQGAKSCQVPCFAALWDEFVKRELLLKYAPDYSGEKVSDLIELVSKLEKA